MNTPYHHEPCIEVRGCAQPTLTALVRSPQRYLARDLRRAIRAVEHSAGTQSMHRTFIILQRFAPSMVELALSVPLRGVGCSALTLEPAELPVGRYLTVSSGLAMHELASAVSCLHSWLAAHRESAIGPLFLELIDEQLIFRQRILGGGALGSMMPVHEDELSAVAHALHEAQRGHALEVAC